MALWAKLDAMWNGWKVEPKSSVGGRMVNLTGQFARGRIVQEVAAGVSPVAKGLVVREYDNAVTGNDDVASFGQKNFAGAINRVVDIEVGGLVPIAGDAHSGTGAD